MKHEECIKKQALNSFAFGKSKPIKVLHLSHTKMLIPPETYAFLLEHHFKHIRKWVLYGDLSEPIDHLLPILEDNDELISAWVHHNERQNNMPRQKKTKANEPVIGLVEFTDQFRH